jgi:hypothetical protein
LNGSGRPKAPTQSATTETIVSHDRDIVPLRHNLRAVYVRDADPDSIALRRLRRNKRLNAEQARAYAAWLAEQRQNAS